MAFSNSPPWFMTESGSVTGAHDGGNNLRDDMYDAFATYLATVAARFASDASLAGTLLTFDAVTPLNEPVSSWWRYGNGQEGCHFDRDKQSQAVAAVGRALAAAAAPPSLTVAGPEENSIDDSVESLLAYSADALAALRLVTTHTYNGASRSKLAAFASAHGQALWNSEYGTGSGPLQGGLQLGQRIAQDLNSLNCTVWTLWQVLDADNTLSPSGWGLLAGTYHEENLYRLRLGPHGTTADPCLTVVDGGNAAPADQGLELTVAPCAPAGTLSGVRQILSVADAYLRFGNASGPCADDWGQAMQSGDQVRAGSCWQGANQQWNLTGDGRVRLNNASGLCLTASASSNGTISVEACADAGTVAAARQAWTLRSLQDDEVAAGRGVPPLPGSEAYVVRMQYYAFKQYTAFILPGSAILTVSQDPATTTVAAQRTDGRVAIVYTNGDTLHAASPTFTLEGWLGHNRTVEVWQTSAVTNCTRLHDTVLDQNNTVQLTVPAASITTLLTW